MGRCKIRVVLPVQMNQCGLETQMSLVAVGFLSLRMRVGTGTSALTRETPKAKEGERKKKRMGKGQINKKSDTVNGLR